MNRTIGHADQHIQSDNNRTRTPSIGQTPGHSIGHTIIGHIPPSLKGGDVRYRTGAPKMADLEVAYCWEGCGQPATHQTPIGMNGDHSIVALVCADHADGSPFTIDKEAE